MRILMISDFYPPFMGGVEVLVSTLSHELADRGHEVVVTTLAAGDLPATELDDGVRVHRIRSTAQRSGLLFANESRPWAPPAPDPEAVAAIRSVVARERPEIVHGHDWLARSYLPLKRRGGPALVMSLHYFTLTCPKKSVLYSGSPCSGPALVKCLGCAGRHYGRGKGAAVVLAQRTFSRAERALVDLFLPVSEDTASGNRLPGSGLPYVVMPNLVPAAGEAAPHEDLLGQLPDDPFLLFVGDVRPAKGIHVLLDAYSRLPSRPPLVLIGKVWADTPGELPPGVLLLRDWPNAAVRAAMGRSLALVTPSLWREPFGIVVAEALAAGRPVVASAIGGIPEIVRDGVEGLLVPPGDVGLLAGALERIAGDDGLRETLAGNARRRSQQYVPDALVPRIEAAYERATRARAYPRSRRAAARS
jgi:glycosyltransferase involved in cell wall biosynthesis